MSVVVDANLVAAIILPLPYSDVSRDKLASWKQSGERIIAPVLWEYELISVIRRAIFHGLLNDDQAYGALKRVVILNVESASPTESLHRRALTWAGRLSQSRAYDAQYLALAEQTGAEFWTGDQRLANSARQLGAAWVHWVGEG